MAYKYTGPTHQYVVYSVHKDFDGNDKVNELQRFYKWEQFDVEHLRSNVNLGDFIIDIATYGIGFVLFRGSIADWNLSFTGCDSSSDIRCWGGL